jgi:hypothetical protein
MGLTKKVGLAFLMAGWFDGWIAGLADIWECCKYL